MQYARLGVYTLVYPASCSVLTYANRVCEHCPSLLSLAFHVSPLLQSERETAVAVLVGVNTLQKHLSVAGCRITWLGRSM